MLLIPTGRRSQLGLGAAFFLGLRLHPSAGGFLRVLGRRGGFLGALDASQGDRGGIFASHRWEAYARSIQIDNRRIDR